MTTRIAVLDDYQGVAHALAGWDRIPDAEVVFFTDHLPGEAELIGRLEGFEVIGVMRERTPFPRSLLAALPHLRLLVTTGRRNASIDLAAACELGITVCGTDSPGHATAELAWGLLLNLARGISTEAAAIDGGRWQVGLGRDLRGATLGVVGLGRLGSQVAGFGLAFGMEVIAWSENLTEARAADVGVRAVSKHELFATADFVSIHQRLSERTVGLVGREELAAMRSDAYLINTSRAPIVDQDALVDALRDGGIAGAALDVFDEEPLPADHPLRSAPRLLMTPHIGYVTRETYSVFYPQMVEAIEAFLAGTPIRELR